MKERAAELKAEAQKADGEKTLLAKVAEMKGKDKTMAKKIHAIVKANAPDLRPKTWYGMPAYANEDGKIVVLLPGRREVRVEVCDVRVQRRGESRRGRHVAHLLRAQGADRRRREEDRRAREESRALAGFEFAPPGLRGESRYAVATVERVVRDPRGSEDRGIRGREYRPGSAGALPARARVPRRRDLPAQHRQRLVARRALPGRADRVLVTSGQSCPRASSPASICACRRVP